MDSPILSRVFQNSLHTSDVNEDYPLFSSGYIVVKLLGGHELNDAPEEVVI